MIVSYASEIRNGGQRWKELRGSIGILRNKYHIERRMLILTFDAPHFSSSRPSCNVERKKKGRKSEDFPITALLSYQEIATFVCRRSNVRIEETNPRCNIENGFPILRPLSSSAYLTDQENNVDFPTYSKNSISDLTWRLRLQNLPTFRFGRLCDVSETAFAWCFANCDIRSRCISPRSSN